MHYHNHGCVLATIVSILMNDDSLEMGRKKASKEETKKNEQEHQEEEAHSGKKVKRNTV